MNNELEKTQQKQVQPVTLFQHHIPAFPYDVRTVGIISPKQNFMFFICGLLGTAVAQWLRCCATNRKVAGSIPDGVTGFFR